ncbi:HalOD1 output domain-containing protein [Halovivax cerinus]|uniref:HalOD1 output domain-containing protein n=1 Tax=Halovivax cerinus TaxID=1487865 RepID=A0ABD5NP64_9EURY|nr:HalOD1 output domain-containing protein [Halovivax cerinus]
MHAETNTEQTVTDSDSFTYQRSGTETPTEGVLEAVSTALDRPILPGEGTDPLPPMYDAIDPDALDTIFDGSSRPILTFEYAGCTITVEQDEITVERV